MNESDKRRIDTQSDPWVSNKLPLLPFCGFEKLDNSMNRQFQDIENGLTWQWVSPNLPSEMQFSSLYYMYNSLISGVNFIWTSPTIQCFWNQPNERQMHILYQVLEGSSDERFKEGMIALDNFIKKSPNTNLFPRPDNVVGITHTANVDPSVPFSSLAAAILYNIFGYFDELYKEFMNDEILERLIDKTASYHSFEKLIFFVNQRPEVIEKIIEFGILEKAFSALDNRKCFQYALELMQILRHQSSEEYIMTIFNKIKPYITNQNEFTDKSISFIISIMPDAAEILLASPEFEEMLHHIPEFFYFSANYALTLIEMLITEETAHAFYKNSILDICASVIEKNMGQKLVILSFHIIAAIVASHDSAFVQVINSPLSDLISQSKSESISVQLAVSRVFIALISKTSDSRVVAFLTDNDAIQFIAYLLSTDYSHDHLLILNALVAMTESNNRGEFPLSDKLNEVIESEEFKDSLSAIAGFQNESEEKEQAASLADILLSL